MSKNKIFQVIFLVCAVMVLSPFVNAQSYKNVACITSEISDISPSSVKKDSEFTVGVQIENCGEKIPKNIVFEITEIPPGIIINDPIVSNIPKLSYGNSERFLTYHMQTRSDAKPGIHVVKTRLSYGDDGARVFKDSKININVIGEDAEPRIESVKTDPLHIYEGDSVDMTLGIKNFGDVVAKSVKVRLDHQFKGVKEVTLGSLDLNGTQSAIFRFKASNSGEFTMPVIIEYEDDFGRQKESYDVKITVLDRKGSINIASVKVNPVLPYMGDTVEATLRVENFGERTINSIRVYTDHPFQGLKESFIGTLDPDEDGPAVVTFMADRSGEFEFPVTITYQDDFGEESVKTKVNLIILEKNNAIGKILVVMIVLVVIAGLIYYNFRIRKSKDKVIKQLMKGNENSSSRKK